MDSQGNGNLNSIGIEICVNSDGDFKQAVANAAALTRKIMKDEGISKSNVVQHNKWSGKNCPTNLRNGSKGITWNDFMAQVGGSVSTSKPSKPTHVPKPKPSNNLGLVDYLKSKGINSSFSNRKKLASKHGISNYSGTASQNNSLLAKIKGGGKTSTSKPSANLKVDGYWGQATTRALQRYFKTPVDGVISKPSVVIKALQRLLGVKADGYTGPVTYRAMQLRFKTPVDGKVSKPSVMVKELQRRLNRGKL